MIKFGSILGYKVTGQKVNLSFQNGTMTLDFLTDRIVNVFSAFFSEEHYSKAIEGDKHRKTKISVSENGHSIEIRSSYLTVKVSDGGFVDFFSSTGKVLSRAFRGKMIPPLRISAQNPYITHEEDKRKGPFRFDLPVGDRRVLEKQEVLLGLGDKAGFINKRGYEYENWNSDVTESHDEQYPRLYKSVPFMIGHKGPGRVYGIFYDNSFRSFFNMGKDMTNVFYYAAENGNLDYYFIGGDTMPEIVTNYTYLTGRTPLPQRWTLGYQQSRWGYITEDHVRYLARAMRENDIPCDVIHLDIDYMDNYKVFTWNKDNYTDPKKCFSDLKKDGIKIVTIVDPGVKVEAGYPTYEEGLDKRYYVTDGNGLPYVARVWPGDSVYPDFGRKEVRDWWGNNLKFQKDLGIAGIWNDMNEPASFRGQLPDDCVFYHEDRKATHTEMHNVFGHYMSQATYEGLKKWTGKRPFVITRACFAGTQKYSTVWTGDNRSSWLHLRVLVPQLCTLGLCGISFAGVDLGGFSQDCTPELMQRWMEASCFSPLFRNHSGAGNMNQEPWCFAPEVMDVYRKYVKLHYAFIPYLYDLFFEGETNGLGVMRPLGLHYESDDKAMRCNSEYMVGSQMIVAPVLEPEVRERLVYLPRGVWYDMNTGRKIRGGRSFIAPAPIDTLPMYAKEGAILPNYEDMSYVGEKPYDTLILRVFPGNGSYVHYEDNGEDFAYREGEYNAYRFTVNEQGIFTSDLIHDGYSKKYKKLILDYMGTKKEIKMKDHLSVQL